MKSLCRSCANPAFMVGEAIHQFRDYELRLKPQLSQNNRRGYRKRNILVMRTFNQSRGYPASHQPDGSGDMNLVRLRWIHPSLEESRHSCLAYKSKRNNAPIRNRRPSVLHHQSQLRNDRFCSRTKLAKRLHGEPNSFSTFVLRDPVYQTIAPKSARQSDSQQIELVSLRRRLVLQPVNQLRKPLAINRFCSRHRRHRLSLPEYKKTGHPHQQQKQRTTNDFPPIHIQTLIVPSRFTHHGLPIKHRRKLPVATFAICHLPLSVQQSLRFRENRLLITDC